MLRLRPLAVSVGIIVALCLLGLWGARSQTGGLRRVTTTTDEGININPSLSGDGRRIAFESTEDLAHAGGSDHFRAIRADLGTDPAGFVQFSGTRAPAPGISQDGSRIAFAAKDNPLGTNADGNSEIFLYDGSTLRQVTNTTPNDISTRNRDGNFQPSLTDDGRFIAFSSNRNLAGQNGDGNLEIIILDTNSNLFTQLTNTTGAVGASDAKISGDGTRVAYIRDTNALSAVQRDLMLQDRVGGTTRLLAANVQNLALTYGRAISDDGLRVVYSGDIAADSSQVFLFDGRLSNTTRQITALGIRTTEVPLHPTISGDGTRLAFATRRPIPSAGANTDNSIELYTYDIPTGQFARVTNAPSTADGFSGSTRLLEVVSSLNDDGSVVAFNFPRVISGAVTTGLENNSEIYSTGTAPRPTVGSLTVVNGASHGNEPATTEAVAPDSYAAALGGALASTTEQAQKQPNGTFPTTVAGTTVTVNGRSAQIFYVSPTLVYFLVPAQTELGTATVIITNSEGFRSQGTVPVLRAAPGLFTTSGDGTGEGVVLNAQTEQPGPFDPSDGNLRLLIFATGVRNATTVTATAAGRALTVESVSASADMPGFDEIRVRVPADLRGTGTVNLVVRADGRDSNPVTVVFSGAARNDLIINEVLADPPDGAAGDANQDGVRDSSDDEFVEIVNNAGDIDISGYQLLTRSNTASSDTVRFTFPSGTLVPAGSAIVVFGGGNPNPANPAFGGAQIFKTTGGLSLTNSGGVVTLRDASQSIVNIFSYGGSTGLNGDGNQSLTRSPDITGGFVQHGQAPNAGGRVYSPGTRVDGTPFASGAGRLTTISISPPSANVTVGQSTQFTAQARDQFNRAMTSPTITFASDNTTVATVDSVTKDPTTGVATATVTGRSQGTAHITATATEGGTTITSSQATINVFPPPPVANRVEVAPTTATINRGNTQQFTATAFQPNNQPVPGAIFTWSSSNTNVATIDNNGFATGVGVGTVTITATTSDGASGTISGTATLTVEVPLVINEILADPAATSAGDSNRDGTVNSDDDEFVELVNNSAASVDVSGVIVADSTNNRFTFPANTILPAGRGVVIFGGGTPPANEPAFGGSLIFTTASLGLNNTGDTVIVKLPISGNDVLIASQTYGAEGGDDQSVTRSPDLTGAFVKHTVAANADGRVISPGTRVDGTPFGSPAITRIEVTPPSASVNIGGTQVFTGRAFSNVGGPEIEILNVSFIWDSTDATKATVAPTTGRTTTATGVAAGSTTIRARAGGQLGSASLTVNPPAPTLTINDVSQNEGNGGPTTFTFTVSLTSPAPAGGVTFDIATADVTAQDGNPVGEDTDYVARALTGQTIAAGQTTYTFDVTVNGDVNIEPNETFVVNVSNVSGATLGDGQGQGTIQNDDSASLAIDDVSLTEGNSGTKTFTFTVSLTQPAPAGGVTFDIATADGTATTANNDYVAKSLTGQSIGAGGTTYTFDVTVNGDTAVEANETFFVNVSNVSGASVNDAQGQGTIQNDDTALVVISQLYGGGGNTGATYTHDFIELFNRGTTPVDLTGWSVQYVAATGSGTWAVTNLSGTIQPGQYYLVQEASTAAIGSPLPTPDATGSIGMAATAGKVALVSTTSALSGSCPSAPTIIDLVGYGTTANCFEGAGPAPAPSATASDHRANNGCTDTNNNAADFAAATPTPRNTATPFNVCSAPNLSINDVSQAEGNSGTTTFNFTVSLSSPAPAGGVSFTINTADGTTDPATAGSDYIAIVNGSGSIAQNATSTTVSVTVNGDTDIEPNETFFVNISNVTGANVTDAQGLGTITNDDAALSTLSINDVSQAETNAGTTTFNFTVSLSSPAPAGGVSFTVNTADGTTNPATAGSDYVAIVGGSGTITSGNSSTTVSVTVNGDVTVEPDETFFVNLSGVTGATSGDVQGLGTIQNDDAVAIAEDDVVINEFVVNPTTGKEYVELLVTKPGGVDLRSWTLSDVNTRAGSTGSTEGDITLPSAAYLSNVPQGTFVVVVVTTPSANSNSLTEDLDTTDSNRKLVLITGTTTGLVTSGTFDISADENIQLYAPGGRATARVVDQVLAGGSTAYIFAPDGTSVQANWGDNSTATTNDNINGGSTVPGNSNIAFCPTADTLAEFQNNDTGTRFTRTASSYGTPAARNTCVTSDASIGGSGVVPNLSINDVSQAEGNSGTTTFNFTVSLSSPAPAGGVSFTINTADGTTDPATAGSDYVAIVNGSGSIAQNDTSTTVSVTVNGDTDFEPNETFFVNISNVTGANVTDAQGLGTITNDDAALPTLSINDVSQAETNAGTTTFNFTVSLSSPAPAGGVSFTVNTADGTTNPATAGSDYVAIVGGSGSITSGNSSTTVSVTVNGDVTVEPDETFFVNISGVTGATLADGQGLGTIQNDDSPSLSIDDVSMAEGNSGTTTFTFTVSLTQPAQAGGVTFDIATADGTAQDDTPASEDNDYVARSLTSQSIAEGNQTYTFDVTVNGDTLVEPNETFSVNVTNVSGATVSDGIGLGTIQNDDAASLVISQVYGGGNNSGAPYQNDFVEIFNRGTTTVDFSVTPYSVQYAGVGSNFGTSKTNITSGTIAPGRYFLVQEGGGATNGVPLPTPDAIGTIAMGNTSGKVALVVGTTALPVLTCPGDDGSSPFNPVDGTVADFVGYGSTAGTSGHCYEGAGPAPAPSNTTSDSRKNGGCIDTDVNSADFLVSTPFPRNTSSPVNTCVAGATPTLSINDVTAAEGNSGTTTFTFTVSLSAPAPSTDVFFDIATQNNTATTANSDYVSKSSTNQVIPAGQTSYSFTVTVNGDVTLEPDETFFVNVTNVSGATLLDGQGIGTIQNDELPALSIDNVSATEGDAGTKTFTFTVSLSQPALAGGVSFDIATQNDTATTADNDYVLRSLTSQTIGVGNSTYTFDVTVNGDTAAESNETFFVNVTNVSGATVSDGQGVGTIQNDDAAPPALSINDVTQSEGNAGTTTFTFTVSLTSAAPAGGVTFDIATADGTAQDDNPVAEDNDYVARSLTSQTISVGNMTYTFDVTVNGDVSVEPNETFFVNVSNVVGATVSDGQGQGTITNDDAAGASADLSVTKTDTADPVAIGNDITYTITATNSGPDAAASAVMSDTVPTNTTFRSITAPGGWTCGTVPAVGGTGAISCTNPSFGVGSSVFTLVVRIDPSVTDGTTISNTASVSSSTFDSNGLNNSAIQTTTAKTPLLVISQIYPGGGNAGATYTNDFIEIFNRGTTTVDFSVTPYSIQYTSQAGNFGGTTAGVKTDITSGTLAPGKYFLIQGASGGANGVALPTPEVLGSIAMSATAGKVALVRGTTALPVDDCPGDDNVSPFNPNNSVIVDFVGYGGTAASTTCYEGSGPAPFSTSTAGGLDPDARSTIRTSSCTDTNVNSADFSNPTTAPTARNSSTAAVSCP